MRIGIGNTVPERSNLPGQSGGGGGAPALAQVNNVYSMEFDATNKIQFGNINSFERTDSFSSSCWVNLNSLSNQFLFSKMTPSSPFTGYVLYIDSGKLQFLLSASFPSNYIQVNSVGTINSDGNWNHLAFTYDGSSLRSGIKLYINGVEQAVTNVGQSSVSASTITTTDFQISGRSSTGLINGKIDEVSIFNVELTAQEIQSIYNATETGKTADLNDLTTPPVKWYRMGD